MNCNDYTEKISAYIDGMLDSGEMQSVKKHIDSCDKCAVKYKAMSSLSGISASLSDITVPDSLLENVLSGIDKPSVQPKIKKFVLPAWVTDWRTYSSVAACILAVFLVRTGIDKKYNSLYEESFDYTYESKLPADDTQGTETDFTAEETAEPSPDTAVTASPAPADTAAAADANARTLTPSADAQENVSADLSVASVTDSPAFFSTENAAETEQSSAAYSGTARSGGGSSSASSGGAASAKTTITTSELDREKDSVLSKYDFTEKGSMVKRRVIFTIPDEQNEAKAAKLFSENASQGESAVASALNSAGINYKKNEIIAMDYTSSYNALVRSGNSLKEQVSSATSTDTVNNLDGKLSSVESQLSAISKACSTVELTLK